jgi:hypothetical protein
MANAKKNYVIAICFLEQFAYERGTISYATTRIKK